MVIQMWVHAYEVRWLRMVEAAGRFRLA
jgi:hypothetical protein